MDYKKAFEILEIDTNSTNYTNITIEFIKKNWYIILPWFFAIAFFTHIIIKHNNIFETLYAHLSKIKIKCEVL